MFFFFQNTTHKNTTTQTHNNTTTQQHKGGFDGTTKARDGEGLAEAAGANLRGIAIEQGKDDFSVVVLPDFFDSVDTLEAWVSWVSPKKMIVFSRLLPFKI